MTGANASLAPAARPSWWWRGAAWVATSAGVVVLAYVIAFWGWHWLLPRAPATLAKEAPERGAPAILASPMFGRPTPATAPTAALSEPATLQGDTRLLGVFAGGTLVVFGVIFLANLEMGFLLPPVGLNLFLSSSRFNTPLVALYRHIIPFLIITGIGLLLITYTDSMSLGILRLLGRHA
jgi:hypothetical protein